MSYDKEKGILLGDEKDLEVERIQEKEGENEIIEVQKGSKDVSCTIEDDLSFKQVEKTKEIEN